MIAGGGAYYCRWVVQCTGHAWHSTHHQVPQGEPTYMKNMWRMKQSPGIWHPCCAVAHIGAQTNARHVHTCFVQVALRSPLQCCICPVCFAGPHGFWQNPHTPNVLIICGRTQFGPAHWSVIHWIPAGWSGSACSNCLGRQAQGAPQVTQQPVQRICFWPHHLKTTAVSF